MFIATEQSLLYVLYVYSHQCIGHVTATVPNSWFIHKLLSHDYVEYVYIFVPYSCKKTYKQCMRTACLVPYQKGLSVWEVHST